MMKQFSVMMGVSLPSIVDTIVDTIDGQRFVWDKSVGLRRSIPDSILFLL
jgi:hypothetical protein